MTLTSEEDDSKPSPEYVAIGGLIILAVFMYVYIIADSRGTKIEKLEKEVEKERESRQSLEEV